jgi:hypothetical protein
MLIKFIHKHNYTPLLNRGKACLPVGRWLCIVWHWYNETMQKIATKVFICASIAFGIIGVLAVLTASWGPDKPDSHTSEILMRMLFITVFIILPSFALSIAGKYLNDKK